MEKESIFNSSSKTTDVLYMQQYITQFTIYASNILKDTWNYLEWKQNDGDIMFI